MSRAPTADIRNTSANIKGSFLQVLMHSRRLNGIRTRVITVAHMMAGWIVSPFLRQPVRTKSDLLAFVHGYRARITMDLSSSCTQESLPAPSKVPHAVRV